MADATKHRCWNRAPPHGNLLPSNFAQGSGCCPCRCGTGCTNLV